MIQPLPRHPPKAGSADLPLPQASRRCGRQREGRSVGVEYEGGYLAVASPLGREWMRNGSQR